MKKKRVKEADIKQSIIKLLRLMGIWCYTTRSVGIKKEDGSWIPYKDKGLPDIGGIIPAKLLEAYEHGGGFGIPLYIEVKTPERYKELLKHPTPHFSLQLATIKTIEEHGGVAFVATSVDDAVNSLKELGVKV